MRNLLAAFLIAAPGLAVAGETAAVLKIGVGARALGMGGAFTAVADDVSAIAWNPAGLSGLTKREVGMMHAELVADTRYDFIGYAHPTNRGTFGAGAAYLSQGALEGRDAAGKPTGGFTASDSAVQLAYAAKAGQGLRLGGNLKFLRSTIADAQAQGMAMDLGGRYEMRRMGPGSPMFGLALLNLGPGMRFAERTDHLPLALAVGTGYRLPVGLTLAADVKHRPYGGGIEFGIGTEYAVLSGFAVRGGYNSMGVAGRGSGGLSSMKGFATGFGLKAYGMGLDYSITPFGEFGNVQRFSLGMRF